MASSSGSTPLQNLSLNGRFVEVIGVVVDFMPPSPTAGTDWQCTFNLADELGSYEGQRVKIFAKPDKMPPIRGTGDVVILRQIQLKNYRGSNFLLFNYQTKWTIFHLENIPEDRPSTGDVNIPSMVTPGSQMPTKDDMLRAIDLAKLKLRDEWESKAPEQTASRAPIPAPVMPMREKFSTIADVGANRYFDLIGQVVKMFPTGDRLDLYITDYTENCLLYDYNAEGVGAGDDGREGDEYSYLSSTTKKKQWKGPSGKYTMTVTLFWPHVSYAQSKVREGDYVLLQNVHVKLGKDGSCRLEGALHTDQKFPERVCVEKVSPENDDRVKDLLRRKKYFQKENPPQVSKAGSVAGTKRTSEDATSLKGMSKNQIKKARRKQREAEAKGETANDTYKKHQPQPQSEAGRWANDHVSPAVNKQIACTHPQRPTRPIAEINDMSKSHVYIAPDGQRVPLPFINQLFRAKVRVVDFQPAELTDFAVRTSEFDNLSDDEDPPSSNPPSPSPSPSPSSRSLLSDNGDADEPSQSRKRWTWFFTLIVQDAHDTSPKGRGDRIAIHLADADAEFLLGMEAANLRWPGNEQVLHQLREKLFLLWGDLEERKSKEVERKALADKDPNSELQQAPEKEVHDDIDPDCASLPFVCCVKEYGVQQSKGVWKRRFRMFGTSIQ